MASLSAGHRCSVKLGGAVVQNRTITATFAAALASCVFAATAAAAGAPHELFKTDFLAPKGHTVNLAAGVTYKASVFPVPIRVTVPDGTWAGSQWKYDSSFQHMRSNKPPYYAWVTFERHVTDFGHGAITFLIPEWAGRRPWRRCFRASEAAVME